MLSRNVIAAAGALLGAFPAGSLAQFPMVDGALGPVVGRMLPRLNGRSAAMPELFNGLDPFRTPALNTVVLMHEDSLVQTGPRRMGVVQPVGLTSAAGGRWTRLEDGGWLWVATIQATGALGTRLEVTPWPLVSGSRFTLYNTDDTGESFGPFDGAFLTGADSFWTPTLYSANVTVEYYLPPGVDHLAPASQLTISNLLNQYRAPTGQGAPDELGCHLDVTCQPAWASAASGVAALSVVANQFGFFCSGSIMNRIPGDFTPLFQTATHCGITTANASSVLVTWFFQTNSCNGTLPPLNTLPQTLGAVLLSRDPGTDWTLIGLRSGVPSVTFLGWDSNYVPNLLNITNISHPDGAFKRIAFGTKLHDFGTVPNATGTTCNAGISYGTSFNAGNGLTEPGSSGSPLFDGTQHIRGCLSCGSDPTCSGTNFSSWGRLDLAFNGLAPFLTPPNPVFANAAFGGNERGTAGEPFRSLGKSMFSVIRGNTVNLQAGSYNERLTVDKAMTLQAIGGLVTIGQ